MPAVRTPVIVGVGQVNDPADDAPEPVELFARATDRALDDSGSPRLRYAIESIRMARLLSWRYPDPAALVATRLGIDVKHTVYTTDGGQTPQALINQAALDIQAGHTDVVVVGGAESWRARNAWRKRGERPPWTSQPQDVHPTEIVGAPLDMSHPEESALGVIMPIQVYPMFESAIRHANGQTIEGHLKAVAELWSGFSAVAAQNPYAVLRNLVTAEQIATPSASNRMIGFPYTKLMNSNNNVNQAASIILCSLERARTLGVPADRMIFPWCGAEANDTPFVSNRRDLHSSPAIAAAGAALFGLAGVGADEVTHVDLYSCFPSAVQVAATELGLALDRRLTVTGGLTFAGGPWNDYVSHSIAAMVDVLRADPGAIGLCTANGGLLTKHALGLYSSAPGRSPFRRDKPVVDDSKMRTVAPHEVGGPGTVEAYTVMHGPDGEPEKAIVTALLDDGRRAWRTSTDPGLMTEMERTDVVGRPATLVASAELALD